MNKLNSVELRDLIHQHSEEIRTIVEGADKENRDLTEEETSKVEDIKKQIEDRKQELKTLEEELKKQPKEEKNTRHNIMKKDEKYLIHELRDALDNRKKELSVNAETRTITVQGQNGVHDEVVETEIQGILEPLYANSVLSKLGVRWYTGMKHGDIQVPIMGKSNVFWESEIAEAQGTGNAFTTKKLSPKRLTAYVDISKQLIYQDTIGAEAAIRRDLVNALQDKLEATILGAAAGDAEKPAGIFNGVSPTSITTYKNLCDFEAGIEESNIGGDMKYLLSPKAKAALRNMAKSTKSTQLVFENNEVDGTAAVVTTNVASKKLAYGNWNFLALGSWGNVELQLDESGDVALKGCVRIIINAYFDAVILRPEAFAFGDTTE
ncbi:phage major capsid protein [Sharpea azabuensis]|uniref:phage major capsid protein n=1 Tax=Sharpea azabuensis TaxID=322505 RepID=UPI002E813083|nr:phage major capsid protein [Sharpea azabuensis]MEE3309484.1 phage major capsid protein [Sharpea azabuensis]